MNGTPQQVLSRVFGYDSFRPGQQELIGAQLAGRDVLGIMPTGGGKSICYQLPALMLPGITLVISPLISLMTDQVQALVQLGVRAAYLNSTLTPKQLSRALDNACQGMYKIIYLAPERLNTPGVARLVQQQPISLVCVDEAHCVSQWGQDFRPGYLEIPGFLDTLPRRPVVAAFTATATPRVRQDIVRLLQLQQPAVTVTGFDRSNLYFEVREPEDKFDALVSCLERFPQKSGIVYCLTRKEVETVHQRLCRLGYHATRYHAGLELEERRSNQEDFIYDRSPIIVATNAFGMGIDKSNVSFVIHYNMPRDLESYYQEAGRAGRDGMPASCIMLYSFRDLRLNQYMIDQDPEQEVLDPATRDFVRKQAHVRLNQIHRYAMGKSCLRNTLLGYFGQGRKTPCGHCSVCNGREQTGAEPVGAKNQEGDNQLLQALVDQRLRLSMRHHVSPTNIISDLALYEMSREKPENEFQLLQISGMTLAKSRRYGRGFLRVIAQWKEGQT